jgi:hypothetical protein
MFPDHEIRHEFVFEALERRFHLSSTIVTTAVVSITVPAVFVLSGPVTLPLGISATGESSPIVADVGQQFSGEVGFFAGEISAQPQTLQLSIDWGDGTSSGGTLSDVTLADGDVVTGVFGSHTYPQPGLFPVTIQANEDVGLGFDGIFGSASAVAEVNGAQNSGALLIPAIFGEEFSGPVGSFAAPPGGLPDDAQATIDWGDGTTSVGQIVAQSDGTYSVIGSHIFQPNPFYGDTLFAVQTTVVSAETSGQPIGTINSMVQLSEAETSGLVNSAETGQEFSGLVGSFPATLWTDSSLYLPGDYLSEVTIDWGDGVQTAGQLTQLSDGTYQIDGSHTYAQDGYYLAEAWVWEMRVVPWQAVPGHIYVPAAIYSAFNVGSGADSGSLTVVPRSPAPVAPAPANFTAAHTAVASDAWLFDSSGSSNLLDSPGSILGAGV